MSRRNAAIAARNATRLEASRSKGLGFKVKDLGITVWDLGLRDEGPCLGLRV